MMPYRRVGLGDERLHLGGQGTCSTHHIHIRRLREVVRCLHT